MNAITELIGQRRLLPGEQIRQEELGQRLGLSRGPIREALKALSTQQVVRYSRHRGYFVAQFSADDMHQLYRLRELAETELLRSVRPPSAAVVRRLRRLNAKMAETERIDTLSQDNDTFHHLIFALSPQTIIYEEAQRWWRMTMAYRGISLTVAPRATVLADHDELIDALEALDHERLVEVSNRHRSQSFTNLLPFLPASPH